MQQSLGRETETHTMRHERRMAGLRDAPRTPLLAAITSGTDSELVIDVGVYVQHYELGFRTHIHVLKMIRGTFTELKPVILGREVIIHLKRKTSC